MGSLARNGITLALWACAMTAAGQPASPELQDSRMKWFRESKFGLFIHWGLYAVPAGEWKGRMFPGPGEWIMHDARIPVKDYEPLAARFNPIDFDAEGWVKFAEDAGAKYIVVTAKHHDGFAMFRSMVSRYNIYDATPFHRDPLKELADACAKHRMKLGFYYSQAVDWHERNGAGNDWDFGPDDKKDFDQYLRDKAEPQVKELLTNYGPVALIWFDTPRMMDGRRAQRFTNLVHSLQPATLINGRLGSTGDYVSMVNDSIPNGLVKGDWETPATINQTWGFKRYDNDWKSADDLIFKLVDTVSKGGNYLLNVGPTAEGIVPRPSLVTLQTIGEWLKFNGEAVYGAGPTPFGDEFGREDATRPDKNGRPSFIPSAKWRCTTKPGKLYITLFQWPDGPLELDRVRGKINKVRLLADNSGGLLKFTQVSGRVSVELPKNPPVTGTIPARVNRDLYMASIRAHLRCVVVLETQTR
jgi:alpha-L-fucosidase